MNMKTRFVQSQTSSDLAERPDKGISDVDIVRATGAVAQKNPTGVALWRLKYSNDKGAFPKVVEELTDMMVKRGSVRVTARALVEQTLMHWLNDICQSCHGRGFEVYMGTPVLSENPCQACDGSGKAPFFKAGEGSVFLEETISRLEREVGGAIMRKLSDEMDF